MSFLSLPMLPVHGCVVVHTHLHRKKDSARLLSLSQVLPSCLNVLFYLCTCSRRRERDFLTWLIKGKGLTTAEHPQKSLKQHKNPGSPKISSNSWFLLTIWSPPRAGTTHPSLLWNHPSLELYSTPCPPSEMVQPIPPHPPSICHSHLLSLGFAPPTHTLCKCQSSETERERE